MFDRTDIRAAVEAGAISDEGAKRFEAFLKARNDPGAHARSENLRFLTNFNDVFLTIGIVVLMAGLGFLSAITDRPMMLGLSAHFGSWRLRSPMRPRVRRAGSRWLAIMICADPANLSARGCWRNTSPAGAVCSLPSMALELSPLCGVRVGFGAGVAPASSSDLITTAAQMRIGEVECVPDR
jgi:hypothetical protein